MRFLKLSFFSFILLFLSNHFACSENKILNIYSEFNTTTHIVITTNFKPIYQIINDDKQKNLAIKFININNINNKINIHKAGVITNISLVNNKVLFNSFAALIANNFNLTNLASDLWQISFNLEPKNNKATYYKNIANNRFLHKLTAKYSSHIFTIVLDPGHGGIDSGAIAKDGTLEKNITLTFAKLLRDKLKKHKNLKVFLTREDDKYLYLDERVAKARKYGVDLFISIHADIINSPKIKGATVYTLSKNSSDNIAKTLEESQNKVDELKTGTTPMLSPVDDILINLASNETNKYRSVIVQQLIKNIKKQKILMINHPSRSANFKVLKALDFPSVLIELGYLSNKTDKKTICTPQWQIKMANAIENAIENFIKFRNSA